MVCSCFVTNVRISSTTKRYSGLTWLSSMLELQYHPCFTTRSPTKSANMASSRLLTWWMPTREISCWRPMEWKRLSVCCLQTQLFGKIGPDAWSIPCGLAGVRYLTAWILRLIRFRTCFHTIQLVDRPKTNILVSLGDTGWISPMDFSMCYSIAFGVCALAKCTYWGHGRNLM